MSNESTKQDTSALALAACSAVWMPWPPPMDMEDRGWWWLRDSNEYRDPIVVHLNCNQAMKIGVCFNELDDLPLDWSTAECAPCVLPQNITMSNAGANTENLINMEHIFEVVDATDDERYYTLGVFLTEAGAMSLTDGAEPPYNEDDPEVVTIEVRRRPIGFHPHAWEKIAEKTWVRNYADDAPDWTPQPVKLFCQNVAVSREA